MLRLNSNFVFVVNAKDERLDTCHHALAMDVEVVKPPRTTWRGTPEHRLWLLDPTDYETEIYVRLTLDDLALMPADKEPEVLMPGAKPMTI